MEKLLAKRARTSSSGIYLAWRSLIYKINMYDQTLLWQQPIEGLGPTICVEGDIVYAYSAQVESFVYAFQSSSGVPLWTTVVAAYEVDNGIQLNELLALTVVEDTVYVLARCGSIYALSASTGEILSYCETEQVDEMNLGTLGLLIVDTILYSAHFHILNAIDSKSSQVRWQTALPKGQNVLTLSMSGGRIYASADKDPEGSYIYAIAPENGTWYWASPLLADPIFVQPLYRGEYIFCTGATTIYALAARDGHEIWEHHVGVTNYHPSCSEGEHLYICLRGSYQRAAESLCQEEEGTLLALNFVDGALHWSRAIDFYPTMFHVKRGILYVRAENRGDLYAFDADNGASLWHVDPVINEASENFMIKPGFGSELIVIP
ncbi:outer membrane protein assembly factor BamB family protein [Dictyobacter arantiisoli]|uniref:Pyrrolo-quinoline quinone repeat domain-containing protein n=1 Tax=Dictyobacter arantiisoli TaxID=2014874 RepID=A0A5A5T5N7_9CHLR|nr:PQQ-binding-like beta-propeller repeat protein [Dictyobacter arantiisoli]GCF06682.1 hypothetical protein KDI_02460 [Dictyobacter arantiisoli]